MIFLVFPTAAKQFAVFHKVMAVWQRASKRHQNPVIQIKQNVGPVFPVYPA